MRGLAPNPTAYRVFGFQVAAAEAIGWPHPVPTEHVEKTDDTAHHPWSRPTSRQAEVQGDWKLPGGRLPRGIQGGRRNRKTSDAVAGGATAA